jgi:hypothetical protein
MRTNAAAAILVVAAVASRAKAPTAKVIVSGEDITSVIEITNGPTIAASNLFSGAFLDTARGFAAKPQVADRYEVDFYLPADQSMVARLFERPRLKVAYVAYYVPTSDGPGLVYLPGPGEPWAAWNHGTIIRPSLEGHWLYASDAWGRDIASRIARARHRSIPATCPTPSALPSTDPVYSSINALSDTLNAHGISVRCAYHGTEGILDAPGGATLMTNMGPFAVQLFPSSQIAGSIRMTAVVVDGRLMTVLRRDGWAGADTLSGASPASMLVHGRMFFDTFGQLRLDSALRATLVPVH